MEDVENSMPKDILKSKSEIEKQVRDKFDYFVKVDKRESNRFGDVSDFNVLRLGNVPPRGYFIQDGNEVYVYEGYMDGAKLVAECFTKDEVLKALIMTHGEDLAETLPQAMTFKNL